MIRSLVIAAALALGACAATAPVPVSMGPVYRDQSSAIGVTSRYDAAKFAGLWYVRAGFDPDIAKMAFRMIDTAEGPKMRLGVFLCDAAGVCGDFSEDLEAVSQGKGRFRVSMPDGRTRDFWVLWVDEGFRTAVLGNKAGTFGWIIDRSTSGGADRIKAAREILDFNGYDVSKLKVVK